MMMQLLHPLTVSTALVTDPTWIFSVVLCIILLAPLLLRSLRIPHVIGLILAGVLVGKYGLNILDRDSSFQLFGQVGIYYIMFLAGLELDMGSVQHYGRDGIKFGLFTFLIPFFLGLFTSYYLLHFGIFTSVLMACIYSSHTLVTYPTVGRYGLGRHRVVVKSVVATAFALFVSLLVLAFVIGSLKPDTSLLTWINFGLKCCVYVAFVLFVFPRLGRWFLRRYSDSVMQYIFILALVFLSASFAKMVGLEGLLGAFLAGLVVNRLIPKTSPLMSRLEFVGNAIFIPYFLIGVGMLIDVRIMLGDPQTLWIILVMVVTGTLSKLIASAVTAWWSGEDRNAMWLMFGLTNAHAAGALAIVMIGTNPEVNLMNDQVLNGTVMLILFSCIISGFATSRGARRLALSDTTLEDNRGSYHGKCLITYSQHVNVDVMTQLAILIRNPYIPDSLMGLCVSFDGEGGKESDSVGNYQQGKQMLERAQEIAAAADVPMATLNRMSTNIAGGILRTMKEYDCGEVVMCLADRTTGMLKSSLGPIIDDVVGGSHREVMIVRSIVPPGTIRRVVVAVPQKAEYEVGFYKWLEHICRIGEQLDCHLEFHAYADTLPYIRGYMQQKHSNVRTKYTEMNLWTQLLSLQHQTDANSMLIAVTARPGFISYQPQFDNLPLQIHRYFGHTSVMLLYPDQWGDPLDSVSVFTPNGTAVTRQHRTLGSLIRRLFLIQKKAVMVLALLLALPTVAQQADYTKMSAYVRQAVVKQKVERRKAPSFRRKAPLMSAIVRSASDEVLLQHDCKIQAQWGDLYIVTLPTDRLAALSREPDVQRIEAGEPCVANMDTSRSVIHVDALHAGMLGNTRWTGKGVVMGIMDIGFDLTHPTFYSADGQDYRIRSFWDMLDYTGKGDNKDSLYIGCEYNTRKSLLRKAHATDGLEQFHGTHTAGTAAGSGYISPYIGAAPEADICLVANAVGSDRSLVPDSLWYLYNTASDLLGFKYIFDYADRHHQPCVISFSEGRKQELYGDDMLAFEVLDSLLKPGHILCSSAGNDGFKLTYLHKPVGKASASSMLVLNGTPKQCGYYLRSSGNHRFQLHFYATPTNKKGMREYTTEQIYSQPDSMLIDTVSVGVKDYMVVLASYPSCYNREQVATELFIKDVTQTSGPNYRIGLTLLGEEVEAEAITYNAFFENPSSYPDFSEAVSSHSINFPSCSPNIICVGSTGYRTGVRSYRGDWLSLSYGSDGMRTTNTSIGPSHAGLIKPDVMAPGQNIIAAFSSYYAEANPNSDYREWDVERFQFEDRQYSWSAQSGTSMASPIVGGIIACWMQAFPRLSYQDAMEAIAATSRRPDAELSYPNNYYGWGEIDAEAGLQYLFDKYGMEDGLLSEELRVKSEEFATAVYDLAGRRVMGQENVNDNVNRNVNDNVNVNHSSLKKGLYIVNGRKILY